ncbi:MAG: GTP cyclohydrolase I [Myxococcales bacterium]|jgi:GTP cyclohydrolase I
MAADRARAAAAIEEFLRALGRDPAADPDLGSTGRLVAAAYADDLLGGYAMDPAEILDESVAETGGDVVALRDLQTTIMCPHHLLPAGGVVHLAYAPAGRVVGLGALGRLVDCFARRLILQETFVQNIADALCEHLGARGAGCVAELSPACLTARGERRHGAVVSTVATAGQMRPGEPLHATFLHCMGGAAR